MPPARSGGGGGSYTYDPSVDAPLTDPNYVPPPPAGAGYDPAQDTQGMQAQPSYIAPATPQAAATSPEASYAYGTGQPYYDTGYAPEYTQQTIYSAPQPPPPEAAAYAPPPEQGYMAQMQGSQAQGTGKDTYSPFPSEGERPTTPVERIRRKVGTAGSWFDTPTAAGSFGQPPADTNNQSINPMSALSGTVKFLQNYVLPGHPGNLAGDVINDVLPYEYANMGVLKDTLVKGGATPLPEPLQYLVPLARYALFQQPTGHYLSPQSKEVLDQTTGNYLGADREYLGRMAALPSYLRPFRPAIARGAHALANLPYPGWTPPMPPQFAPTDEVDLDGNAYPGSPPGYDIQHPEYLEPGRYYDDPYIPGPDRGPRWPTA